MLEFSAQECSEYSNFKDFTKEQLMQLCEMFYQLLKERQINVTVQASPNAGSFGFSPVSPFYTPNYVPNNGPEDPLPQPAKIWCTNTQGAHNKSVSQVESTQQERFGSR